MSEQLQTLLNLTLEQNEVHAIKDFLNGKTRQIPENCALALQKLKKPGIITALKSQINRNKS
jgi:hypothetical protein